MSGTQPQDLPSGENPGDLADSAALPDESRDDDVIDISRNEGPELTTDAPGRPRPVPDDEP
jgi:hypothetical protein